MPRPAAPPQPRASSKEATGLGLQAPRAPVPRPAAPPQPRASSKEATGLGLQAQAVKFSFKKSETKAAITGPVRQTKAPKGQRALGPPSLTETIWSSSEDEVEEMQSRWPVELGSENPRGGRFKDSDDDVDNKSASPEEHIQSGPDAADEQPPEPAGAQQERPAPGPLKGEGPGKAGSP